MRKDNLDDAEITLRLLIDCGMHMYYSEQVFQNFEKEEGYHLNKNMNPTDHPLLHAIITSIHKRFASDSDSDSNSNVENESENDEFDCVTE